MAEQAMGVLRRLFGEGIPAPSAVVATKWASDPYAKGDRSPRLSFLPAAHALPLMRRGLPTTLQPPEADLAGPDAPCIVGEWACCRCCAGWQGSNVMLGVVCRLNRLLLLRRGGREREDVRALRLFKCPSLGFV